MLCCHYVGIDKGATDRDQDAELILSTIVLTAGLFGADRPEVGIWKLNVARSTLRQAPRPMTMTIEPSSASTYSVTFEGSTTVYSLTFDVEPVPDDSAGTSRFAKRVDDRHSQQILKVGGRVVGTIDMLISDDGKLMTCVYRSDEWNINETFVYDRE